MQEPGRRPLGRGRLVAILMVTAVAVAAFVLLLDARFRYEDPLLPGVTDQFTRPNATALFLGVEAVALVAVLVLLLVRPQSWEWEGAAGPEGAAWQDEAEPDSSIQIGCPGCGTVFEKPTRDVDEPHEQTFLCPNCGRTGRLRMNLHRQVEMRSVTCANCAHGFTAYRDNVECPRCHTAL